MLHYIADGVLTIADADKIYIGITKSPDDRLKAHNDGKSSYTKKFMPWQRFYLEEVTNRVDAIKKEKYYKSGWGRRKLKQELEKWQITWIPLAG